LKPEFAFETQNLICLSCVETFTQKWTLQIRSVAQHAVRMYVAQLNFAASGAWCILNEAQQVRQWQEQQLLQCCGRPLVSLRD
jgi:hypothetical protein